MELAVGAGSKLGVGMVVMMQKRGLKVRRRARWDWAGISSRAGLGFGVCEITANNKRAGRMEWNAMGFLVLNRARLYEDTYRCP